jgi:hypothetical protein
MIMRIQFICIILLTYMGFLHGQNESDYKSIFPSGITIEGGFGKLSVRDEFISKEKYSGTLPQIALSWSRFNNSWGFRQRLEYHASSDVKNYNISTDIVQFSLHRDYLYPVGKFKILSRDVFSFLGPSTELFLFYNKPNFNEGGIHLNYSFVLLVSSGINGEFIIPLKHGLQIESSTYLSILSLGLRTPEIVKAKEDEGEEESVVKLLTPFSGFNSVLSLGIRYQFHKSISMKLNYKFQLTRISSWDPLLSASDNIIFSLTYHI